VSRVVEVADGVRSRGGSVHDRMQRQGRGGRALDYDM
jgi:hypothetical protein